jgi:hypothetical protein
MILTQLRDLIQIDIGNRGLRTDPERNLINACPDDFRLACQSIAEHPSPMLAIVTGFFIPTATPPAGETDGPLGALFLARALTPLGISVALVTDDFCMRALEAGLDECGLRERVPLIALPSAAEASKMSDSDYGRALRDLPTTHLLAIERVGPNCDNCCHTMRGRDITALVSPAHRLFQSAKPIVTIGIGDGGNEIGMGKIPAEIIARNIPNGNLVACQIATDYLIVCGVSNWGAYALAAGIAHLRKQTLDAGLFDPQLERRILEIMVQAGPLVDGVTGTPSATVDGLTWGEYTTVLAGVGNIVRHQN